MQALNDTRLLVLADLLALLLDGIGAVARLVAHLFRLGLRTLPKLYDVYVAIPLKIERSLRAGEPEKETTPNRKRGRRAESGVREESLA